MNCINCGKELPPDTAMCPYCAAKENRKKEAKKENKKIFVTIGFCVLILALIVAAFLIFMPRTSLKRDMEQAESSYAVAALCSEHPDESGNKRYQLILLDAADDIMQRYTNETCGYNQTVTALSQLNCADNAVVRDKVLEVWAQVERSRFIQLTNHKRSEQGLDALKLKDSLTLVAEAAADEYEAVGMGYLNNLKKIVSTLIPDYDGISAVLLYNAINAQDALVQYEEENSNEELVIYSKNIKEIGADAVYDQSTGLWSYFVFVN